MRPILETTDVTKTYTVDNSTITAVDNVSLDVKAGEFVALVGPSGSGKTTMLAILAGLLTPSQGQVMIDDQTLSDMSEKHLTRFRREMIGFTFQAHNLVPYLTVLENVELMLRLNNSYNRQSKQRAKEILGQLGLGQRLNNLTSQLSGGQQQRVAIARSLIHNPKIVLADEPTASLDTERAYQVVETFANLIHVQNLAGIMVTHDMRMCKHADKIVQMQDGRVRQVVDDKAEIMAFVGSVN